MQTSYTQGIDKKEAGLRLGLVEGEVINSFSNFSLKNKLVTALADAIDLETGIKITLQNGYSAEFVVNVGGGAATKAALAALLSDAILEDENIAAYVATSVNGDDLLVAAKLPGYEFNVDPQANLSASQTTAAGEGEEVGFGLGVVYDAEDRKAKLPTGAGDKYAGATVKDTTLPHPVNGDSVLPRVSYLPGDIMAVLRSGRIYARIATDVLSGQKAYLSYAAATKGQYTNSAVNAIETNKTFDESGVAGGLALITS